MSSQIPSLDRSGGEGGWSGFQLKRCIIVVIEDLQNTKASKYFLFQPSVCFLLQPRFLCRQSGFKDVKLNNPVLELHMRVP